ETPVDGLALKLPVGPPPGGPLVTAPRPGEVRDYRMLIGGEWHDSATGARFDSVNPYTGEVWASAPLAGPDDVDRAVSAARQAFDHGPWGRMTGTERARLIRRLAELIAAEADALAAVETTDNGKLIREMGSQLQRLPEWYYYFAGAADKIHGDAIPSDKPNFLVYTRREPVGVVAAVLPWNSPLLLLSWKLATLLAAGCTVVVKPAEQTPASVLEFARLFEAAGFPPGVFNVVTGDGSGTGAALVSHPGVDKVAFTGSTETGVRVMKSAADHLAKVTLELGGKSPNIVFDDADPDTVVDGVIAGIFAATGQTCIAGSRLLVQSGLHDRLVERLVERARSIRLGDPMDPETEMGPVAFADQLDKILAYVRIGREEGAKLVCGGRRPTADALAKGLFVQPTVFTDVDPGSRLAQEEIFGPVLAVIPFRDEEEAVELANDTPFGLGAGVWTDDIRRGHRMAHRIKAGTVWLNSYRTLSFNAPFSGWGMSGVGSENGLDSLREYTRLKSVWVELSGAARDPFRMG
ncbi:aldehyde dehydrogenase, partial [Streptomyces sp. NPDC004726]